MISLAAAQSAARSAAANASAAASAGAAVAACRAYIATSQRFFRCYLLQVVRRTFPNELLLQLNEK